MGVNSKDMNKNLGVRDRNKTLVVVEGKHEKENMIRIIFSVFSEISISYDNIVIFDADVYDLYKSIVDEYGEDWDAYDCEIDIPYLISNRKGYNEKLDKRNFTNIILIFDYERHDTSFSFEKITRMQKHFTNISEDGILYINYPMVESYLDMPEIPDDEYIDRQISVTMRPGEVYKKAVYGYSAFWKVCQIYMKLTSIIHEHIRSLNNMQYDEIIYRIMNIAYDGMTREGIENHLKKYNDDADVNAYLKNYIFNIMKKVNMPDNCINYWSMVSFYILYIGMQNIVKAYKIQTDYIGSNLTCSSEIYDELDFYQIMLKQNTLSEDNLNGNIWVLNCFMTFLGEYKFFWNWVKSNQETK